MEEELNQPNTIQVPPLFIRAAIVESSINDEERTIDVVFGTENPIRIRSWDGTVIHEILSFNKNHVNLDRLNSGAPVLNNHRAWGDILDSQLGVVEKAWISKREGHATLRFSKEENVTPIWNNISNKIYRNVSVGYNVYAYTTETVEGENHTTYTATDWEPAEISMTPIPADIGAGTRSAGDKVHFQTVNLLNSRSIMEDETTVQTPPVEEGNRSTTAAPEVETRSADTPPATTVTTPDAPAAPTVPAPAVEGQRSANPDITAAVQQGIAQERQRVAAIRSAVNTAMLPATFADTLISNGSNIDQARAAIFAEWEKSGTPAATPGAPRLRGDDVVDKRRSAIQNAITHRANPSVELTEQGRQFRSMSLMEIAKDILTNNGFNVRGKSNVEIAQIALQTRSMHTTSDFPIILGNTINRELRRAYELQPRTFLPFCSRGMAKDFREMTRVQLSNVVGSFDEVKEGGEYQVGTFKEGKEVYRVVKYGKMINVSWEMLINDDLSAFNRIPRAIASKAAQKQSDIVWGIITGSHLMGDGVELFHADHNNLASSGGAISSTTLSKARESMRNQKDLNNEDFINVSAKYLMVGPAKETEAQQQIQAVIRATKTADTNVFRSYAEIIVEPRLSGNQWYLAADPAQFDTIEYSFLDGEGELFTTQRESFEIDGMQVKARMVFGAKALDWKGFWKNPGN